MGDVPNAAERVRKLARALQFPGLRSMRLERGGVQDLLRLLHFALLDASRALAGFLLDRGYDLRGQTDMRFVEGVFRLLRDEFRVFPPLSAAQFLSTQFVERRLLLTADVLALALRKRAELQRERRQQDAVWSAPTRTTPPAASVDNHVLPREVADHAAELLRRLGAWRADSPSGRRVRVSRVRRRDAPSARSDASQRLRVAQDAAEGERSGSSGSSGSEAAREDRESVGWTDGGGQSEDGDGSVVHAPPSCPPPPPPPPQPGIEQALATISQQLAGLSEALGSRISRVEGRLAALEARVSGVQASVSALQQARPPNEQDRGGATRGGGEGPCAWPPPPGMFDRY